MHVKQAWHLQHTRHNALLLISYVSLIVVIPWFSHIKCVKGFLKSNLFIIFPLKSDAMACKHWLAHNGHLLVTPKLPKLFLHAILLFLFKHGLSSESSIYHIPVKQWTVTAYEGVDTTTIISSLENYISGIQ